MKQLFDIYICVVVCSIWGGSSGCRTFIRKRHTNKIKGVLTMAIKPRKSSGICFLRNRTWEHFGARSSKFMMLPSWFP